MGDEPRDAWPQWKGAQFPGQFPEPQGPQEVVPLAQGRDRGGRGWSPSHVPE